jgi:glutathione S-transferase
VKLYDAARCPFCARVRLVLAEKGLEWETVEIDLSDRPGWLYDLNPAGKVPVLDHGFILPESPVIMEFLEDRYPEPALFPDCPKERARARLAVFRFDDLLGDEYYKLRRGEENAVAERLEALPLGQSLFVDFAYLPWLMRLQELYGAALPPAAAERVAELEERPAVAAELEIVRGLAAR